MILMLLDIFECLMKLLFDFIQRSRAAVSYIYGSLPLIFALNGTKCDTVLFQSVDDKNA